jgi:hypothetical protein
MCAHCTGGPEGSSIRSWDKAGQEVGSAITAYADRVSDLEVNSPLPPTRQSVPSS